MNGNQQSNPQAGPPKRSPRWYACVVGDYVRALVVLVFWLVIGAVGLAAAYIGIRGILWAAELVLDALGVK